MEQLNRRNISDNIEKIPEWLKGSDKMTSMITSQPNVMLLLIYLSHLRVCIWKRANTNPNA